MFFRVTERIFSAIRNFFGGFADVVQRLNLLGRITFGFVAAILVVGIVLAIVLPQRSIAANATEEEQLLTSIDYVDETTATPTSAPTPTLAPTPTPDPTLQQGDESEKVQQMQERLMSLGYMNIDESTRRYGPITKNAVMLFQRQHELQQDGIAGMETLEAIYADGAKKYTLMEGMRGSDVDSLQRQLIDLGYLGEATGYYGTKTVDAVEDFQARNKLGVDGICGEQTLNLLYSPNAVLSANKVRVEVSRANILEMIASAKAQLGDPYIRGREGPDSFDCSGLVYYVLKQAGSSRRRYNAAGYSQVSDWEKISSMGSMEIGDLIFFYDRGFTKVGHVGIYIGGGYMIDASSSNAMVVKRKCDTSYWTSHFVLARRPW